MMILLCIIQVSA